MPNNNTDWDDYLVTILNAIASGRHEIKTVLDMTPEQRAEWKDRLVAEEKDEIKKGLDRHNPGPTPE